MTKNGRGRYVLLDIQEYEKQQALIKLLSKLSEAEDAIKTGEEWKSLDDLKKALEVEEPNYLREGYLLLAGDWAGGDIISLLVLAEPCPQITPPEPRGNGFILLRLGF